MTTIVQIPTSKITFFVKRARPEGGFNRLKESIKSVGLKMPIQVRKEGDEYALVCGQGRLQAFRELRIDKIPAIIVDVEEKEIVGRFLAENVMRKKLPWQEKARLIKADFDKVGRDLTKGEIEEIAKRYFITAAHVVKLLKILQQASPKVADTLDDLTIAEAETLTSLPGRGQDIVIQTIEEEGLGSAQMAAVVRKAKELGESGELSKSALKASLKRVNEDLERQRKQLKLYRLHASLGPSNLEMLLTDPEFRRAIQREKVNVSKFEAII